MSSWAALGVLAASAVGHLRSPSQLLRALSEQKLIPSEFRRPVAVSTIGVELAIGAGGLALLVAEKRSAVAFSMAAAAALYAIYAMYTAVLVANGSSAPCGCAAEDYPITVWVPLRAFALAAAAALAALLAEQRMALLSAEPDEAVVAALASTTFAVVLWNLPRAMDQPLRPVDGP